MSSDYNLILDVDSYKASHYLQYPPHTSSMFSYFESRGGLHDVVRFFGLQYILKRYLSQVPTMADVDEATEVFTAHGVPFNVKGWTRIVKDLGYLPIRIRSVAEGRLVPTHNVLFTVESTDPETFWIVNWLETMLSRVWYPSTVCTISYQVLKDIRKAMEGTCDTLDGLPFKLHDFGARGVSSHESAGIGGLAHLVNFMGTDTVAAITCGRRYYNETMAGFSIPAAEHSTITSWGKDREVDAYRNMLAQFAKPNSLVAVVSDSYDLYHAVEHIWGDTLKQDVIDSGATVVIRPDSGNPREVIAKTLGLLDARFGSTENSKGYKVLNNVRVIQGDGMDPKSIKAVLDMMVYDGWSIDNIAFGMGGGLLQKVNRDTQKFAYKCSSVTVDGNEVDVFKDPITDPGKKSKKGRLSLIRDYNGHIGTRRIKDLYQTRVTYDGDDIMQTVFEDGKLFVDDSLKYIRERQ